MQTTDFVLIWLVAMVTAIVIVLLKLAALALVGYLAFRAIARIRRIGARRFVAALWDLAAGVVAALLKLVIPDKNEKRHKRNVGRQFASDYLEHERLSQSITPDGGYSLFPSKNDSWDAWNGAPPNRWSDFDP